MIVEKEEHIDKKRLELMGTPDFEGTIIDIETYGRFDKRFPRSDARVYQNIKPTVFGAFDGNKIIQIYLLSRNFDEMKNQIKELLKKLQRPYYAFNARFEMGVLSCVFREPITLEYDLQHPQSGYYEKKEFVFQDLLKSNGHSEHKNLFQDPYNGDGYKAIEDWIQFIQLGDERLINRVITHNRACLLKEWYILSHRKVVSAGKLSFP